MQFKRKVTVLGRSMVNNVQIAIELGYLDVPEGVLIEPDELNRYPDDQILILTTGSQGEPMAGLSRMASNNHRSVSIMPGDTAIISATPIPGNETGVGRTIDNLMRLGANVIAGRDKKIHVSGHASQEELKLMLELIKPKYFIPVHGEYRMLKTHGDLAVMMGVARTTSSSATTARSLNSRTVPAIRQAMSMQAASSSTVSASAMSAISSSATASSWLWKVSSSSS